MDRNKLKFNFINKAKQIHKDENLDYLEIEYVNNRTPVKIIDHDIRPDGTEYGEFWQTPSNHLKDNVIQIKEAYVYQKANCPHKVK